MKTFPLFFCVLLCSLCLCGDSSFCNANPPTATYIFPAGAQRGTSVDVRVGGLFLYEKPAFEITGSGITTTPHLTPIKRVWFEGPLLPLPESQQQEDYPADLRGKVTIANNASLGGHRVRVFTSQGGASGPVFVVGELPELIEKEIDGEPIPQAINMPVTANGRIFPREDIDLWEFDAPAGKTVTAFVHVKSINSPLVPKLDILDDSGHVVAEQMLYPCVGTDASVKFTSQVAGKYRVRITDARALGGQAYVYRLTVTTENVPEFHFPIQGEQDGLQNATSSGKILHAPLALNGKIDRAGKIEQWRLELKKGTKYTFDLQARRYQSPLCGAVSIVDASGRIVAEVEASQTSDPGLPQFTPPSTGTYTVAIRERFRGRAGANFVYRLRVLDGSEEIKPGFQLTVTNDVYSVPRGGTLKVNVVAKTWGGFHAPIEIKVGGLPKGVEIQPVTLAANQSNATLSITAGKDAAIGFGPLSVVGHATIDGKSVSVAANYPGVGVMTGSTDLRLAIILLTPFKIIDQYVMTTAPRGETYYRHYKVDRGGFDGPIQIQLADKQARHLQGVTGPMIALKPGETEFDYPAFLPPWMEMGRTCRVCVMATAKVKDPVDGREHTVSFSSTEQNQQMIVVVGPGRLDVSADKTSVRAEGEVRLAVKVSRSKNLTGPATVEVILPEHLRGVTCPKLIIPTNKSEGEVVFHFAPHAGPFNGPLLVRATVSTAKGPVTAETKVDAVK